MGILFSTGIRTKQSNSGQYDTCLGITFRDKNVQYLIPSFHLITKLQKIDKFLLGNLNLLEEPINCTNRPGNMGLPDAVGSTKILVTLASATPRPANTMSSGEASCPAVAQRKRRQLPSWYKFY